MGRKINVSQPVVVNTELKPLDIAFNLEPSGALEQWYYDNTGAWSPNRKVTPLIITPSISAMDTETNTSYQPTFYAIQWFVNEYKTNGWVESQITNTTDSEIADYVIVGNNLKVKKNVSYDRAVQIRCAATYIDPRDQGKIGYVEKMLTLNCSKDANVEIPSIDVLCESSMPYNPLVRETSIFSMEAIAYKGALNITNNVVFKWFGVNANNQEVDIEDMDYYVSGQGTKTLTVDAVFSEEIKIVLRAKESASATEFYPAKVYRSIIWRIPDIDTHVVSNNGQAYRGSIPTMEFSTIINLRGKVLSEEDKKRSMRFNWKTRQSRSSVEVDHGWGLTCTLNNTSLQSTNGSVLVYPDVYILGAAEPVTHNGEVVTHNNRTVFHQYP